MQPTTYLLSESYIRRKMRLPIAGPLTFALVLILLTSLLGLGKSLHPIFIGLLGFVAFLLVFFRELRARRESAKKLPKMAIEVTDGSLRLIDSGGAYEVPFASIKAVLVDRRQNGPKVVYLQRIDAATIHVDNLDRMDQFATQISRIVGAGKVRDLLWWQRPPR